MENVSTDFYVLIFNHCEELKQQWKRKIIPYEPTTIEILKLEQYSSSLCLKIIIKIIVKKMHNIKFSILASFKGEVQ